MITVKYRTTDDDIVKLKGQNVTETKTLSFGANLNLGAGLPAVAVNFRNYNRKNGISEIDTTYDEAFAAVAWRDRREDINTTALNLNFMYRLELLGTRHSINLSYNNLNTVDLYDDDRAARGRADYSLPNSPVSRASTIAIGINSNISKQLTTTIGFDISEADLGEPDTEDIPQMLQGNPTLVRGFIAQDLLKITLGASYRMGAGNKMLVRGAVFSQTSTIDRSLSEARPDPSSKLGIRGGFEMALIENLQLVTAFEFRQRTVDHGEDGEETVPASIFSATTVHRSTSG